MEQLLAAKVWVFLWGAILTFGAYFALRGFAPPELLGRQRQVNVAAGMCLLLTDIFFLHVTIVPLTGEPPREQSNLAISLLKYFAFVPVVASLPVSVEPWIETGVIHFFWLPLLLAQRTWHSGEKRGEKRDSLACVIYFC